MTIADPHADPETSFEIMTEPTKSCNFLILQGLFKSRRGESNPGPTDYESVTSVTLVTSWHTQPDQ